MAKQPKSRFVVELTTEQLRSVPKLNLFEKKKRVKQLKPLAIEQLAARLTVSTPIARAFVERNIDLLVGVGIEAVIDSFQRVVTPLAWADSQRTAEIIAAVPAMSQEVAAQWAKISEATINDIAHAFKNCITPAQWCDKYWTNRAVSKISRHSTRQVSSQLSTSHAGDKERLDKQRQAIAEGRHWIVIDGSYYRYIEDRGWETATLHEKATIEQAILRHGEPWFDGPIISRNHGTVFVPPYIKTGGIKVVGYTKNPPGEGHAEPRDIPLQIGKTELAAFKVEIN